MLAPWSRSWLRVAFEFLVVGLLSLDLVVVVLEPFLDGALEHFGDCRGVDADERVDLPPLEDRQRDVLAPRRRLFRVPGRGGVVVVCCQSVIFSITL